VNKLLEVEVMPDGNIWISKDYEIRLVLSPEDAKKLIALLAEAVKEEEVDGDDDN
jgi:hypothetical protein